MRFNTRDLLLLTTVAAVYTAGLSYLVRLNGPLQWFEITGPLVMVATMAIVTGLVARRSLRRLGRSLVSWKVTKWWIPHLMFAGLFFGYIGVAAWRGTSGGIIFPVMIAAQQFLFLFNRWFVLGENGALLGMMFVPWSDGHLSFNTEKQRLEGWYAGQLWPARFPMPSIRMPAPDEHVELVQRILAEKRGLMRPTP